VTAPYVESCQQTGVRLLNIIGENEKPDVQQSMRQLHDSLATVTELYSRRHHNLIEAMERAMNLHELLRQLVEWLTHAENTVVGWAPASSITLDEIHNELAQLHDFRKELDAKAVDKEQLMQDANELVEGTSPEQASAIRKPLQVSDATNYKHYHIVYIRNCPNGGNC
jgi:hypothetical protein